MLTYHEQEQLKMILAALNGVDQDQPKLDVSSRLRDEKGRFAADQTSNLITPEESPSDFKLVRINDHTFEVRRVESVWRQMYVVGVGVCFVIVGIFLVI